MSLSRSLRSFAKGVWCSCDVLEDLFQLVTVGCALLAPAQGSRLRGVIYDHGTEKTKGPGVSNYVVF